MSSAVAKSAVFHGNARLGQADVHPAHPPNFAFPNNEIRIDRISHPSERCPPLSVLLTLSPFAVRCKLDAGAASDHPLLSSLHSSCLFDPPKTAVVIVGDEELHLVAMKSGKDEKQVCFWCCAVPSGLYDSCLGLLNQRCLAIVFDLDETLIVANTMKSFEDRIEFLQRRIACETDLLRASGMKAELKRYLEDKALLKQYSENDQVTDSGKLVKAQIEDVLSLSNNQNHVLRPIIRLPEKNIVLTRINPEIRDTSVLVRLRHAWEDLRSYLTAKGRKRFEVYVCTMAEREYALEMWRLLDPESHLISSKQLADRIACVKSGSRKSLLNVFQDGYCHPKMAMVIDDRLNVWEDCDQPRVHVVPAFAPYYAPQAEMANTVPVLLVARNVACNVRGGFFKEFDEALLLRISELRYEDQIEDLPAAPDVSNYVMTEDMGFVSNGNGNRDVNITQGMSGAEVERRLNQLDQQGGILDSSSVVPSNHVDVRPDPSRVPIVASSHLKAPLMSRQATPVQGPGLLGAAPCEGEVTQSEIERRRLLVYQHGQDMRNDGLIDPPLITRLQKPTTTLPQRHGGWLVMEDNNTDAAGPLSQLHPPPARKAEDPLQTCVANGRDRQHSIGSTQATSPDEVTQVADGSNDDGIMAQASIVSVDVLREIGKRCKSTVEFRPIANGSKDLHFSFEVLFTGEKIGCGMGKTRKEALLQAANNALHYLAQKYVSHIEHDYALTDDKIGCSALQSENGFLMDATDSSKVSALVKKDTGTSLSTSDLEDSSREKAVVITRSRGGFC